MTKNKTLTTLEQEQMTAAFNTSENAYHDFDTDVTPERTTEEIDALSIPEGLKTMMKIEAECNREKKLSSFLQQRESLRFTGSSAWKHSCVLSTL